MVVQCPHMHSALLAYVSACSLSLLFCLSKTQAVAGAAEMPGAAAGSKKALLEVARAFPGVDLPTAEGVSSSSTDELGLMGVLESLLQTQLGVFVFSNFVIACCAAVAAVTTSIFLESLTPSEAGRLTQRLLKYLLFKVALVGMVVLPNEVQLLHWLPWLAIIGEMKMFVGLAKDRLAGLSVTPTVGLSRHMRTLCLLGFILCSNVLGLALLHRHKGALSWAVSLLFALDLGIISVEATKAALSCVSLLMDEALAISTPSLHTSATLSGRAMAFWDNWQGKGRERFFYHTELLADMAVHLLTLLHHMHVWLLHGMSFHLLDALLLLDTRMVIMSLATRVKAHMMHRAATHSLDFTFPDATDKLLMADDAECAICRDKLSAAKQLPCGHLFHLPCLRAWLQQSGHENFKCPICRRSLCVQRSALHAHGSGHAVAGAGAGHQHWRVAGQGRPGLMSGLSLSMSYNDLSTAAGGVRQVSLEEQLLRGVGIGDADALVADATSAQLLAATSMGSSDAEGFDALLAQALAASLQTAHMPPSSNQAQFDVGPDSGAHTDGRAAGDISSAVSSSQHQEMEAVDASCDVAGSSDRDQGQHSSSEGSLCNSTGKHQSRRLSRLACRTASLPVNLGLQQDLQPHGADTTGWSDPLSDSDTAPCGMGGTCTSVLATLMRSGSNSSTATSPPKAGSNAHAGGFVSSSRQAPSTRSHLARSQRHSRSCSHLPDVLGPVGGFSWAPGPPSAGAGTGGAAAGRGSFEGDAVPAVEMLLTQPRDPFRRRQGGRWGRKRIVVSGKDQH